MLIRPVYRPRLPSLAQGLIGWWPFDEGLTAIDYSGGRANGVLSGTIVPVGGIAPGINGRQRQALQFNGTSIVTTTAKLPDLAPFSVSMWFKAGTLATDNILFAQSVAHQIAVDLEPTFIAYQNNNYATTNTGFSYTANSSWHHLVLVDPGTGTTAAGASMYVDAVSLAGRAGDVGNPNASNFIIGGRVQATAGWNGAIDDVRIYNRMLSPGEILALYAEAFQPPIDIETIALMHGTYAAGGATPWLYVQNNRPVIGAGTY